MREAGAVLCSHQLGSHRVTMRQERMF